MAGLEAEYNVTMLAASPARMGSVDIAVSCRVGVKLVTAADLARADIYTELLDMATELLQAYDRLYFIISSVEATVPPPGIGQVLASLSHFTLPSASGRQLRVLVTSADGLPALIRSLADAEFSAASPACQAHWKSTDWIEPQQTTHEECVCIRSS